MDATLNNIAAQPLYVLIFVGMMAFLYVMHRLSLASAIQAETIKAALALAANSQQEATRQNERWLVAITSMNDRFIIAITGQTTAITGQGARLDTIDTSVSGLPALAAAAQGADAMVDEIVAAIQANGVDIQAVNRKLGYMALDTKIIAKYLVDPTVTNKDDVQDIADAPAGDTVVGRPEKPTPPTPAIPAPEPGDEIKVIVSGTVPTVST